MKNVLLISFLLVSYIGHSQVPSVLQQKYSRILFQNGKAHIGNGEHIDVSSIGIQDGKILFVKNALTYELVKEEWDTIIDISGKHVYPGFIAPNVTLGITEIDAVRATNDFR